MKKFLCLLVSLIFGFSFFAKSELGIGLVIIDFDESTILNFYNNPQDNAKPVKSLSFIDDHVNQVWKIKNFEANKAWLAPEAYDPLYDMLAFRCVENNNGWMKVVVNNSTGTAYWLKSSEKLIFTDWLNFLKKQQWIARHNFNNKIYEKPDINSKIVNFTDKDCFTVKDMQDDWILVAFKDKSTEAWIKWKDNNKLLIKYKIGNPIYTLNNNDD